MDGLFIGATKKIVLALIAAVVSTYGMIMYESSGIGMLVIFAGSFLFFWTIFLYHPNIIR